MNVLKTVALAIAFGTCAWSAFAYELVTHGALTNAAVSASALLRNPAIAHDLGIGNPSSRDLGFDYFDRTSGTPSIGTADNFENQRMPDGTVTRSAIGWLLRGAIREDDLTDRGCLVGSIVALVDGRVPEDCNPKPRGEIDRVLNHFFDPKANGGSGQGLRTSFASGASAADWALGTTNAFASPMLPDAGRKNTYSIVDARQAMYYALSGRVPAGQQADETTRNAWWATTFRALGDVMHVLEDMAQPQHTRNEPHPGSPFELYVDERAGSVNRYVTGTRASAPRASLPLGTYALADPRPSRYSAFWHTTDKKGLADVSNANFLTDNRNLLSPINPYSEPSRDLLDYVREAASFPELIEPGAQISFLSLRNEPRVIDGHAFRMTTESVFSAFCKPQPACYSMNFHNYDDQIADLVPQAIAYSAGLLDYFFRGRIDLVKDGSRPNGLLIRNLGPEPLEGAFEMYYDAKDGLRKPVRRADGTDVAWQSATQQGAALASGKDLPVASDFIAPADAKTPGEYVLVFRGDMGEEKHSGDFVGAVAAKVVKAPKPSSLYIAGVDALNRVLTFKVDSNGMRQLNGYDANGQPLATDFRTPPGSLRDIDPVYEALKGQYYGQVSIPRLPRVRQAVFTDGILPSYETQGISFYTGSTNNPLVYSRDETGKLVFRDYAPSGSPLAVWKTWSSADNAEYEIMIYGVSIAGTDGNLKYVRRVIDASGNATADPPVYLSLPTLPIAFTTYHGFREGRLFVSPDGTRVSGFLGSTIENNLGYLYHGELRIVPGKPLSVMFVPGERIPSTSIQLSVRNPEQCSSSSGGTPPDSTSSTSCSSLDHSQATIREFDQTADWIRGVLRVWHKETDSEFFESKSRNGTGSVTVNPKNACPYDVTDASRLVDTREYFTAGAKRAMLADGTVTSAYSNRPAGTADPRCTNCTITTDGLHVTRHTASNGGTSVTDCDLSQSVQDGVTTTYATSPAAITYSGQEVLRSFTATQDGTITADVLAGGMLSAPRFRGATLPGVGANQLVGDVSPVGELFIASPDKSFVFYEPIPGGGMPASITIPPHVARIIAAIWM